MVHYLRLPLRLTSFLTLSLFLTAMGRDVMGNWSSETPGIIFVYAIQVHNI